MPYETKATITGYNDIETLHPEIKELWDFERNEKLGLDLKKLSTRSGLKAYFKCSNCGKPIEELRYIFSVTEHNSVFCNKCNRSIKTSIQEQTLYFYVKKLFDNAINGYKGLDYNNYELDIFLPDFNIGIEYDGRRWHKEKKETDLIKYKLCPDKNITLIRMTDLIYDIKDNDYKIISKPDPTDSDYNNILELICKLTGIKNTCDVNIKRDVYEILARYKSVLREKSFGYKNPEAIKYWDYEKNSGLDPFCVSANDVHDFWFIDPIYGSYHKVLNDITSGKSGYVHPKKSRNKIGYDRRNKYTMYCIETGEIIHEKEEIIRLTGLNDKFMRQIANGNQRMGTHLTKDNKFLIFSGEVDYSIVKKYVKMI